MVRDVKVEVDGVEVPRENIKFSPNGEEATRDKVGFLKVNMTLS